jgi:hypothetical protein
MKGKRGCVIVFVTVVLPVAGVVFAFSRFWFPYGARACWLPCTMGALRQYAGQHNGSFPAGTNAWEALRQLYPESIVDPELLAGISGNRSEVKRRLETGGNLDSNISSWVYFPGFRDDENPDLAIIWERTEGLRWNGSRGSGHAVGFIDGHQEQVPKERWPIFIRDQEDLRREVIAKRATTRNP